MERFIMGIDPGTNFMGYAIIKITGNRQKPELVVSGVLLAIGAAAVWNIRETYGSASAES